MKKILAVALTAGAAILLGAVIGGLSGGFLWLIDLIQKALWENSLAQVWYAPLVICTLGGLLVGLCQRYLGNHPKSINEAVQELAQSGRLAYRHLPQGLVTVGVSLSAGASLGPQAAIMDLLGGLSTWAADVLRRVRVSLHLPAAEGAVGLRRWLDRWPNILAIGLGIFGFGALARGLYSDGFLRMQESFAWSDLPWSVLLGLLGAALGALYQWIFTSGRRLVSQRLPHRPVMRALVAGALFGLCASWLPMMTFSGQHDLQLAYDQAAQFGALTLLAVGLARLIFTAVLLFSGWKGGQFLPLMFASTAFGLGLAQLLPGISAPAGILAVMGGLLAVILPKPWFALALMLLMFPLQYALIPIAAVAAAVLAKGLAVKITHRAAAAAPGLILTTFNEDDLMLRGLQAGARGYLLKDTDRGALFNTIRAAARGETLLKPEILTRLLGQHPGGAHKSTAAESGLTEREQEVLEAVARGERSKEVALRLGISERTVKAHLASIYGKLGVDSRAAAIAAAAQKGWLQQTD